MEIRDNCGKRFKYIEQGCGDVDEGYYCSGNCMEELFNRKYPQDNYLPFVTG